MNRRILYLSGALYLAVPTVIFFLMWVVPVIAAPAVAAILWLACKIGYEAHGVTVSLSSRKVLTLLAIITLWCLLAGVGGFTWQNRWDHWFRNALFVDMVNDPWPLVRGDEMVCYYFGYWLLPALIGKLTGSMTAGYVSQLLFAIAGIYIAVRLTLDVIGGFKWRYVAVFILFGGLDVIGTLLFKGWEFRYDYHIELWSDWAYWEGNSTMLCWVYNQFVPGWIGTMLALSPFGRRTGSAVMCLMAISASFPMMGLFPLVVYYIVASAREAANLRKCIGAILSPVNIVSLIVAVPLLMFLAGNAAVADGGFVSVRDLPDIAVNFFWVFVLEIGLFIPFIWKHLRDKGQLLALVAGLVVYSLYRMSEDFQSRASIPLCLLVMVGVCRYLKNFRFSFNVSKVCFIIVALLACVTPCLELGRGLHRTLRSDPEKFRAFNVKSIYDVTVCRENFITPRTDIPIFRAASENAAPPSK